MADQLQLRGGTTAEHSTFTGALREVTVDTDKDTVVVHDGSTAGGHPLAKQNLSNVPAGTITSTMIADGTIVNADVNASAAIAGTKISPDFGSQNTTTTGTNTAASFIPSSSTAPTNGVYLPAANNVAISTNGTGRLFINSSGQVGVGTSSPASLLHLSGAGGNGRIELQNTSGTTVTNWRIAPVITGATNNGLEIRDVTQSASRVVIDSSGRVGVGTTSPAASLEIARLGTAWTGAAPVAGTALFINNGNNSTTSPSYLQISAGNTTEAGIYFGDSDSNGPGRIIYDNNSDSLRFHVSQSERARIDSSGRLGIGTSSPGYNLHVKGSAAGEIAVDSASGSDSILRFLENGTSEWSIYHPSGTGDLRFYESGSAARVTFKAGGNVGIGTTSPGDLLHLRQDGAPYLKIERTTSGSEGQLIVGSASGYNEIYSRGSGVAAKDLRFVSGSTEAARIDSSGRLLVGTSSTSSNNVLVVAGTTNGNPGFIHLQTKATTPGSTDQIGGLNLGTAADTITARIMCLRDGGTWTPGVSTPTAVTFSTTADGASSPTERMRIKSNGHLQVTTDGGFGGLDGVSHGFRTTTANWVAQFMNDQITGTNNFGVQIKYVSSAPNGTGNSFLLCGDSAADRVQLRSNGGLANYQANDVNLSDRNAKKDISPAADTWDCIKEWEIVNYRYKDQPDDADLNLGVIAQQVAESCPEVITVFQEAKEATEDKPAQEERLGVKEQQMYWMAIKALQEAQVRIEQLEAKVAALESA